MNKARSADFEFMPDIEKSWGLSFQINEEDNPGGRRAGSLSWAGICNTFFWIDPSVGIGALLMAQALPFMNSPIADLLTRFEQAVYKGLHVTDVG